MKKPFIVFHPGEASFRELRELSPADCRYWDEKVWFDQGRRYSIDIRVNPLYHTIGQIAEAFVSRKMWKSRVEYW